MSQHIAAIVLHAETADPTIENLVPTHFAEDQWVQLSEFRPGSPAHVHHAVVYIRPPDSSWLRQVTSTAPTSETSDADPFVVAIFIANRC
jgi:hypothetical protein